MSVFSETTSSEFDSATSTSSQDSADVTEEAFTDVSISVQEGDVSTLNTPSHSSSAPFHAGRQRLTPTGKPAYMFQVSKRPRRNILKRIKMSSQLTVIGEESESLLGKSHNKLQHSHDPSRAPKAALILFATMCLMGAYLGYNDFRSGRNTRRSAFKQSPGTFDNDHREALIDRTDAENERVEEIPILLYDEPVNFPNELVNLADIFQEPYNPLKNKLFIWHIPRAGSTTIKRIASHCMGLSLASEAGKSEIGKGGIRPGSPRDVLRVVEGLDGMHFANVDMSSKEGIKRAKKLHVGTDEIVDLVSSSHIYDVATIFNLDHKGYMVAMMRHPIDRAVSIYYNMKKNPAYEHLVGNFASIDQYSRSSLVENNWMTRFLSNAPEGPLTPEHEAIAKEVLRKKCLIGLLREKTETMRRLESFFNWKADRSQRRMECEEKLLYWDWPGKNRHDPVLEGSEAWNRLEFQNTFDIRLYEYAEKLFVAQGKLFESLPPDF
ncbi:hypothetical protein ACHAXS_011339 [Conticribra weissflogii]